MLILHLLLRLWAWLVVGGNGNAVWQIYDVPAITCHLNSSVPVFIMELVLCLLLKLAKSCGIESYMEFSCLHLTECGVNNWLVICFHSLFCLWLQYWLARNQMALEFHCEESSVKLWDCVRLSYIQGRGFQRTRLVTGVGKRTGCRLVDSCLHKGCHRHFDVKLYETKIEIIGRITKGLE